MSLNEISDEDKTLLTLKGIGFDFINDYNNVVSAFSIIGKSVGRRKLLMDDIDIIFSRIILFLNYGFPDNDVDIISAKDIYNKLLGIKNKL